MSIEGPLTLMIELPAKARLGGLFFHTMFQRSDCTPIMFEQLSQYLIQPLVIVGAVSYLIKTISALFIDRQLEAYRTELKISSDKQIQQAKHELDLIAVERSVQFTNLHEKRLQSILDINEILNTAENALNEVQVDVIMMSSNPGTTQQEKDQRIQLYCNHIYALDKTANELRRLIKLNEIFFTAEDAKTLFKFYGDLKEIANDPPSPPSAVKSIFADAIHETQRGRFDELMIQARTARSLVINLFRRSVGVRENFPLTSTPQEP